MWLLCSFQGPRRGIPSTGSYAAYASALPADDQRTSVSQNSTACCTCCGRRHSFAPSSGERRRAAAIQPGSVDMLGPTARCRQVVPLPRGRRRLSGRCGRGTEVLPRKEVIQPQLPLRLPCYDFTPVTSPTFDGSLPCGLGHRLRVLLTPVV